ncbi:class I SAM-dependent methyltransferase [Bauldia sp.]|uniref:class I SAM-dependent methyltransferase n=1 Tax=Bauldia sp. TaxID=2575872 RepID=UPI003BAA22D1
MSDRFAGARTAGAWDDDYGRGRYVAAPPLPFAGDILAKAVETGVADGLGLYIGCGNGRNYVPMVDAGLDLIGLDISAVALEQLAIRRPGRAHRLVHGDLSALPPGETYAMVIGIQVFQHGNRADAHRHVRAALERVDPGGLFCLRVNAVGTDVLYHHHVCERSPDGGLTVRYRAGPKNGLDIHFFDREEIAALIPPGFDTLLPMRRDRTWRTRPATGQWSQWEGIWRRTLV